MYTIPFSNLSKRLVAMIVVAAALSGLAVWGNESVPVGAASGKVTLCHRTHSTTNPYRRITVNRNAVGPNKHGGHKVPNGSANPAVFDPAFSYEPNNKIWGDVIPGSTFGGSDFNGSNAFALNWTEAGRAIFFGPMCRSMTAKEFFDVELEAGVPIADILADLNSQEANEDKPLLAALGGAFTAETLDVWESTITVETGGVTSLTSMSADVHGSIKIGVTTAASGFDWGTDPTLTSYASVSATPPTVTGEAEIAASLSGLTAGTTYYYRATATSDPDLETESVLVGSIESFTTPSAPVSSTTVPVSSTTVPVSSTTVPVSSTTVPVSSTTVPVSSTTVPVSSTTVPVSSTTVPVSSTTVPSAVGDLTGVVWLDLDQNALLDLNEPVLSGATVELFRRDNAPGAVAPASTVLVRSTTTGEDGRYRFTDVALGTYVVAAKVPADGIEQTYDTDGLADWSVEVTIASGAKSTADFAGVGAGVVGGRVVGPSGAVVGGGTSLTCAWAGADGEFGSGDDSTFSAMTAPDGSFFIGGVPFGPFRCAVATDAGAESWAIVTVSGDPVTIDVQAATSNVGETTPVRTLPVTASTVSPTLTVALLVLLVGGLLIIVGRRRGELGR